MRWLVIVLLPLAGCLTESPGEAAFGAQGSFTNDRTQSDLADFWDRVDHWGATAELRESFPEQFTVTLPETDCYLFVQELEDLDYIATVGACVPVGEHDSPY